MTEWYYGLMIFFIVLAVLMSPFFYARSLRFLSDRHRRQKLWHNDPLSRHADNERMQPDLHTQNKPTDDAND